MEVEEDVGLLEGRGVEVQGVVSGSKHNKSARALGILLGRRTVGGPRVQQTQAPVIDSPPKS